MNSTTPLTADELIALTRADSIANLRSRAASLRLRHFPKLANRLDRQARELEEVAK
jgi:hypothetical protein